MQTSLYLDDRKVYRAPLLDALAWVEHGFGTALSGDWPGRAATTVKQIHSDRVLVAGAAKQNIGEGDALIAAEPGALVAIRTADCLPILMADPVRRAVAAVHAGWRGTAAGIAAKTVEAMRDRFGSRPDDLIAVIGPGIRSCCFEVGVEVAREFQSQFPERSDLNERTRIDLAEANCRQMCQLGVRVERIVTSGLCSCCGGEAFHSYRRDRQAAGRMVTAIGIRA